MIKLMACAFRRTFTARLRERHGGGRSRTLGGSCVIACIVTLAVANAVTITEPLLVGGVAVTAGITLFAVAFTAAVIIVAATAVIIVVTAAVAVAATAVIVIATAAVIVATTVIVVATTAVIVFVKKAGMVFTNHAGIDIHRDELCNL
ncbi:MAG: hypothetical protein K2P02_00400, partial [Lachnospiraceae bacterium]|nr:hypothetical protein [Lachnospiraceae bacterium]